MTCTVCERESDLFLCSWCQGDLKHKLISLARGPELPHGYAPGWLASLSETVLGMTRIGEAIRHHRGDERPMRLNLRASRLLDYAHSVLVEWTRDLTENRGVPTPVLKTTSEIALWLADNVSAIASDQGAALCHKEISELIRDIERMVDRPSPRRFVGPCPSIIDGHRRQCSVALTASRTAAEVMCPSCRRTHNIDELMARLLDEIDDYFFDGRELHLVLSTLNERVPPRTFRDWVAKGKLRPVGYRHPDGSFDISWHGPEDRPAYRLADVRRLRNEKPQKATTGRAAKKARSA